MPDRLEWFDVTIPGGTPKTAPMTFDMSFHQGTVVEIDIKVLDGPEGSVGFFIAAGGSQYVPRTPGSFVRPNDDYFPWPIKNAINSGSWQLTGYNVDSWDHTIQVGFQVDEYPPIGVLAPGQPGSSSAQIPASPISPLDQVPAMPDPLSADYLLTVNMP